MITVSSTEFLAAGSIMMFEFNNSDDNSETESEEGWSIASYRYSRASSIRQVLQRNGTEWSSYEISSFADQFSVRSMK
jgi:hypothetical protein